MLLLNLLLSIAVSVTVVFIAWWLLKKLIFLIFCLARFIIKIALYPFKLLFTALFGWAM